MSRRNVTKSYKPNLDIPLCPHPYVHTQIPHFSLCGTREASRSKGQLGSPVLRQMRYKGCPGPPFQTSWPTVHTSYVSLIETLYHYYRVFAQREIVTNGTPACSTVCSAGGTHRLVPALPQTLIQNLQYIYSDHKTQIVVGLEFKRP